MNRDYTTGTAEGIKFFIGTEIEHTPAYGMKTLFVTGLHSSSEIEKHVLANDCTHIFFGANHSYNPTNDVPAEWDTWEEMIRNFLIKGYLCSLDIPLGAVEQFSDGGLNEYNNFIPQIRVPIPYIKLWNYNTMIKIDDSGFNKSNPGVWSHSLHDLMDREHFTDWNQYKNDEIIK